MQIATSYSQPLLFEAPTHKLAISKGPKKENTRVKQCRLKVYLNYFSLEVELPIQIYLSFQQIGKTEPNVVLFGSTLAYLTKQMF